MRRHVHNFAEVTWTSLPGCSAARFRIRPGRRHAGVFPRGGWTSESNVVPVDPPDPSDPPNPPNDFLVRCRTMAGVHWRFRLARRGRRRPTRWRRAGHALGESRSWFGPGPTGMFGTSGRQDVFDHDRRQMASITFCGLAGRRVHGSAVDGASLDPRKVHQHSIWTAAMTPPRRLRSDASDDLMQPPTDRTRRRRFWLRRARFDSRIQIRGSELQRPVRSG